ncbi:hypothetical protein IHE45_01G008300 [Dioscorea alata]|uniref:Uncharacterized protein n=2 Tax=Dioscorea alata TaxID=55571 RepID=A0ACB7WSV4_DIOAL|nr:hypothetical protein IHE45_01G008300 [Dioscorea alata]KAH7691582.1 hypothetical protein IHE45_01G008300 [Dioscorea alata]
METEGGGGGGGGASQKNLERIISQKAMQMGNSSSCKIWVVGFFCGVCITYLFLVIPSPLRTFEFGLDLSSSSSLNSLNSSLIDSLKDINISDNSDESRGLGDDEKVKLLFSAWNVLLNEPSKVVQNEFLIGKLKKSSLPNPPHLEDCKLSVEISRQFDSRGMNRSLPPWTLWRGMLGLELLWPKVSMEQVDYRTKYNGAYPPWIVGSDMENYPLTRRVQQDIWIYQHPENCSDPNLRFLVADWERLPGFGVGAQFAGMAGLLAIAINEKRILVTNYYNRADHSGCQGSSRSHWSCYFFPETSQECRDRAFDLMTSSEAWKNGIITVKENYTSKEIWTGRVPRVWGNPWDYLQPTTDVDGALLTHHRKMDRRWWRAQAIRYLMRFQSEYACQLLNVARHTAFGMDAAKMVLENLPANWPEVSINRSQADIEHFVWSNHKPWIPRPLLSMHVRMGDKACEMKIVEFEHYMRLADRIRTRFPHLNSIWLSTEMQEVIDKSKMYENWNVYYTNITRQVGNTTMAVYEASLGRETSTNYPLVNFIMATEADFFIGALGSTWCYLIDGMRNTGGKVMAGYLSVNKDRFW